LSTLSADTPGKLDVLGHDGDTLGMDGAQVGVLKQTDEVSLAGLLQSHDSGALETQIGLEVLSDLTHQTLERQLADEELSALLVTTDFSQSDGSWPVAVRFLHSAGGGCGFPRGLGGQLLTRCLTTGRFASGLLEGPYCREAVSIKLSTLSADTPGKLDVLGHDGDTLGMDGAQVGVLKQTDEVSLAGLLQSHDSGALETQIGLEVLSDLTHQTLERQLADEELGALLVTTDFSQSDGSWPVAVRFLHSAGGGCGFPRGLGGQLLTRCLTTGRFASGLLGTCH
ncbi:hypothetical protein EGW08_023651, partial [Elysia chlorotica]